MPIDILITVTCDNCGYGSAFKSPGRTDDLKHRLEELHDDLSMFICDGRLFCCHRCKYAWIRDHKKGEPDE
jgi:hypothetical protein